jgi:methylmalonyl-CoA mutase
MTKRLIFDDFPKPTFEQWKQVAIKSLKGGDFDKLLTTPTDEGITLQPLYTAQDIENLPHIHTLPAQFPYLRGTSDQPRTWWIAQSIHAQSPAELNQALQHDLKNGQTAITFRRHAPTIQTLEDVKTALNGIDLSQYPIISMDNLGLALLLFTYSDNLRGVIADDPLAHLTRDGNINTASKLRQLALLTHHAIEHAPDVKTIAISTMNYHNSGATATQEIAYALASGVWTIRQLLNHDLTIDQIASRIAFKIGIGDHFLLEIAKFRALRVLWAQVVHAFGGTDESAKITVYAQTGITNKTQFDAHTNILRTATEALSAVIAGVDGLEVLPFDHVIRPPDEFSRRVARNQQLILQHEVNLAKLIDPSGGSYAIETLTDQIAGKAWTHFQAIEAQGGIISALQAGTIQTEIDAITSARSARYAKRKDKLVGTNMYVNGGEAQPKITHSDYQSFDAETVIDAKLNTDSVQSFMTAIKKGATIAQIHYAFDTPPDVGIQPLKPYRYAQPFEKLRHAVFAYAKRHGKHPAIYLANIGELRRHKPRTDFTLGFLGVGGFDFINPAGETSVEAIAQSIQAYHPDAVVICGTDDDYQTIVPELVRVLKAQNPNQPVILAGYPKDHVEAYQQAGVDEFIALGADCLALNNWLLRCFNDK